MRPASKVVMSSQALRLEFFCGRVHWNRHILRLTLNSASDLSGKRSAILRQGPLCGIILPFSLRPVSARQGPCRLRRRPSGVRRSFPSKLCLDHILKGGLERTTIAICWKEGFAFVDKKAANFAALQKVRFAELQTISNPWPPRPVDA